MKTKTIAILAAVAVLVVYLGIGGIQTAISSQPQIIPIPEKLTVWYAENFQNIHTEAWLEAHHFQKQANGEYSMSIPTSSAWSHPSFQFSVTPAALVELPQIKAISMQLIEPTDKLQKIVFWPTYQPTYTVYTYQFTVNDTPVAYMLFVGDPEYPMDSAMTQAIFEMQSNRWWM